jgi:hypothetical protein
MQLKTTPPELAHKYSNLFYKACLTQLFSTERAERWGVRCDPISAYLFDRLMAAESCQYCGRRFTGFKQMTVDHVIPISRGGGHTVGNIAIVCYDCNHDKGGLTKVEFMGESRRWEMIREVLA